MASPSHPQDSFPLARLELWAERIHRGSLAVDRCLARLAAEGVRPRQLPPPVRPADGERVLRLKEELLAVHRERAMIIREVERAGGELIEGPPLEILLPGGHEPGSRLSWQPGEPGVAWWRAAGDKTDAPRRPLQGAAKSLTEPPRH